MKKYDVNFIRQKISFIVSNKIINTIIKNFELIIQKNGTSYRQIIQTKIKGGF